MKKILSIFSFAALLFAAASCKDVVPDMRLVDIEVQLALDGEPMAVENVPVTLVDASGTVYDTLTNASGVALFSVPADNYTATASFKQSGDAEAYTYSGSNSSIAVLNATTNQFSVALNKVVSQQIIIKEIYCGGCTTDAGKQYTNDAYIVLYNNSDVEADATNIAIGMLAPYNSNAINKYYGTDGAQSYAQESWLPAIGAIWSFSSDVTIAPYSQIVVAAFGAIDHTETVGTSVALNNPDYYVMAANEQFKNAKYVVDDAIPATHYMTTVPFTLGNAWPLSNNSPAVFLMKAPKADIEAMSLDTEAFDHTTGTSAAFNVVKVAKSSIVDAVEVWNGAKTPEESKYRFSSDVNSGYVMMTNKLGYTIYRNVDKAATEALAENEGKLVYNYALGTEPGSAANLANGTTDPSGIDAEASIAAGAHIIYSDTNNTATDFHQRAQSSLK